MKHFLQASKSQEFDREREKDVFSCCFFFFARNFSKIVREIYFFVLDFSSRLANFNGIFVPKMNKPLQK